MSGWEAPVGEADEARIAPRRASVLVFVLGTALLVVGWIVLGGASAVVLAVTMNAGY